MGSLPVSYSNHTMMLEDYFDKSMAVLQAWNAKQGFIYSMKDMAMAMLYGLDTNKWIMKYTFINQNHNEIANKYVKPFTGLLTSIFPNLDLKEATALTWSGVSDSKAYEDANDDFEFTMPDGNKITKAETRNLSGPYKLATNIPSNIGYTKGNKICN